MKSYGESGSAAFPIQESSTWCPEPGMTLRDWFAGQALQGILANNRRPLMGETIYAPTTKAYLMADAMLEERDK